MTPKKRSGLPSRSTQRGVSLLLALIFVGFFGGILVTLARFNMSEIRQTEARVTGWEIYELAKAARLYVRDQWAANPALRTTAATPQVINIDTMLKAGGYLPENFGRISGGNYVSALNQRIFVVMANWSPTGLGGAVTAATTVPSAFIYFHNGGKSAPNLIVDTVDSARRLGATITAPLFDRNNVNRSANCRDGNPAVGIWDTGCMTRGEFATIAAAIGVPPAFSGGALIMPAWKAIQPDPRVVMRFPQPDNPGFATMLTDLQMGEPMGDCSLAANQVNITTLDAAGNPVTTSSGACKTLDDTAALNRRFGITRIGNMTAQRLIAEPQSADFGGPEAANIGTGNDDAMRVSGDVTLGNDLRVFNVRALPAGVTRRFDVPNGTVVAERNAYLYSLNLTRRGEATIGTAEASALIADRLTTQNFVSTQPGTTSGDAMMNVGVTTTISGNVNVNGSGTSELITEALTSANAVRATDNTGQVQITGTLNTNNAPMTVTGSAPVSGYAAVFAESIGGAGSVWGQNGVNFLTANGSVTATNLRDYTLTGSIDSVSAARCLESNNVADACPNRQYSPPSITP